MGFWAREKREGCARRERGKQRFFFSHWDMTNEGNYHLKLCMSFVCLVPVRRLLSSTSVLYHVNGQLQRAYFLLMSCNYPDLDSASDWLKQNSHLPPPV